MNGRIPLLIGLVLIGLHFPTSHARAQDLAQGPTSLLPRTLHVQIRIAPPPEETCERDTRMYHTTELQGQLALDDPPTEDVLYRGTLNAVVRNRDCYSRCPDGACDDVCYVSSQSSGTMEVTIDQYVPPLQIRWIGSETKESVSENGCPPKHYPLAGLLEDAQSSGSLVVNTPDDAWPPLTDGAFTLHEDHAGGPRMGTMQVAVTKGVEAIAGGPYRVARGEPLALDGSKSRGLGLTYEWRFAPSDCPADARGDAAFRATGSSPSVALLCSMNATLRVTDGTDTDSQTVAITVAPREWETPFEHLAEEGVLDGAYLLPVLRRGVRNPDGTFQFDGRFKAGENVSATDPKRSADETLEPFADGGTWDGRGYVLDQLTDGPFAGYWYVSSYSLGVRRQTLMNPHMIPNGKKVMSTSFHETNVSLGGDIDGYLSAVRAHEGVASANGVLGHSGLVRKSLREDDPARAVELMFSAADRQALRDRVDDALRDADYRLCEVSKDPLPEIWRGRVYFPQDDGSGYVDIGMLVGGGDYGHMLDCKRM